MAKISRAERKLALREEAKRKIRGGGMARGTKMGYRDAVEKGHKDLMMKSAQGGDSKGMKAKNELTFLLNNYLPKYDSRIEALIDVWRRSGDPSYSPSIRTKFRQARRDHMRNSNPA